MKCGILTWHKALNHGAVLQAYATQNVLKNLGIPSLMLDYKRVVPDNRKTLNKFIERAGKVLTGKLESIKKARLMDQEKRVLFDEFIRTYIKSGKSCLEEDCDLVIIGSDMVFNLQQGYSDYMFGIGIKSKRIVSYAASAGGTTIDYVRSLNLENEIREGLERFSLIGVRDIETRKLIEKLEVKTQITDNIDPVLLYGFRNELQMWDSGRWEKSQPYILIYAYHEFMDSKAEVKAIKAIARENNLLIVSCGYYHEWCDQNINATPVEFLEMIKHARFVITDTFHGAVFSIICEKEFGCIIRTNGYKLKYLLECCHLENRIASIPSELQNIYHNSIDYTMCNDWLSEQRKISIEYLKKCVEY